MIKFIISIHRPHTRPDAKSKFLVQYPHDFNSQASYEARPRLVRYCCQYLKISIHRPHTRPDSLSCRQLVLLLPFQFTGLIRGPTSILRAGLGGHQFQFTGLIRGPTRLLVHPRPFSPISIHRPHTRPDRPLRILPAGCTNFNSQASYEARPVLSNLPIAFAAISIHRPHTRPDRCF